jgi:transposase-like protein
VLTELRNRGVKDVLFVCTDGLSGFPEAIDAVFPLSVNQTCIVHLVRQSLRYLSWRGTQELRSRAAPHLHSGRRRRRPPGARRARARRARQQDAHRGAGRLGASLGPGHPFLVFPDEIRRIAYTTNTVESLHMQIRKTIKTRGHFPNDD